jgi:Ca2+-binding RTX toxin-like protein
MRQPGGASASGPEPIWGLRQAGLPTEKSNKHRAGLEWAGLRMKNDVESFSETVFRGDTDFWDWVGAVSFEASAPGADSPGVLEFLPAAGKSHSHRDFGGVDAVYQRATERSLIAEAGWRPNGPVDFHEISIAALSAAASADASQAPDPIPASQPPESQASLPATFAPASSSALPASFSASDYPYKLICYITVTINGVGMRGSGVIIGPHTVLTAAHVVDGATSVTVRPGYPDNSSAVSGSWRTHYYDLDNSDDLLTKAESEYDIAVINFAQDLSVYGGHFGYVTQFTGGTVHATGYPGSYGTSQYDITGSVQIDPNYSVFNQGFTTLEGMSGGPLWVNYGTSSNPDPRVVGVLSTSGWATQLTNEALDQVEDWIADDADLWGGPTNPGAQIDLAVSIDDVKLGGGIGTDFPSLPPGGIAVLELTFYNYGSKSSTAGDIGYYLSTDANITTSDRLLVWGNLLEAIPAGGSKTIFSNKTMPTDLASGTYYLGVIVDYRNAIGESNEGNNRSQGWPVKIVVPPKTVFSGIGSRNEQFDMHTSSLSLTFDGKAGSDLLWSGTGNDTLIGGTERDVLLAGNGNDFLYGDTRPASNLGSADQLLGGRGSDTAFGGGGNDYINGEWDNDILLGGAGNDLIHGGLGSDRIDGGDGNDWLFGASNTILNGAWFGSPILVQWNGLNGADIADKYWTIAGEMQASDASADVLVGGAGNDYLNGGLLGDKMSGGTGNDTYIVDSLGDYVDEIGGNGIDVVLSAASFNLGGTHALGQVENLTLLQSAAALVAFGNGLGNILTGNSFANTLNGGLGNDTYVLGSEATGRDTVTDAGGIDTITSTVSRSLAAYPAIENLQLLGTAAIGGVGNALANVLTGNTAGNVLSGGAGNDTIRGHLGNDTLTGGANNDSFTFNTAPNYSTNRDVVTDFTHGVDKFWMENAVFTKLGAAGVLLNPAFLRVGAAAVDANDFIVYNKATGGLFYDSNANAAGGLLAVAVLINKPLLSASDFAVI